MSSYQTPSTLRSQSRPRPRSYSQPDSRLHPRRQPQPQSCPDSRSRLTSSPAPSARSRSSSPALSIPISFSDCRPLPDIPSEFQSEPYTPNFVRNLVPDTPEDLEREPGRPGLIELQLDHRTNPRPAGQPVLRDVTNTQPRDTVSYPDIPTLNYESWIARRLEQPDHLHGVSHRHHVSGGIWRGLVHVHRVHGRRAPDMARQVPWLYDRLKEDISPRDWKVAEMEWRAPDAEGHRRERVEEWLAGESNESDDDDEYYDCDDTGGSNDNINGDGNHDGPDDSHDDLYDDSDEER